MSVRLKPNIVFNFINGETFKINDNTGIYDVTLNPTGYGYPNLDANSVTAVRLIFSSYVKEQEAVTNATSIIAGVEYQVVGSGSFTYDSKTYNAGDVFISMADGTPTLPSTITLSETGRFQPVTNFIPTDVVSDDFTPSLLGINNTIFPDSVYSLQMDAYTTQYSAGSGIPAGTYLVNGTVGQTVVISGVTYRVGEVFTQGSTFTMTGSAKISLFNTTTKDVDGNDDYVYFLCGYYAFKALLNMQNRLVASNCTCKDKLETNLNLAWNIWVNIINQFSSVDGQIDISGIQTGLEEIVSLDKQANC